MVRRIRAYTLRTSQAPPSYTHLLKYFLLVVLDRGCEHEDGEVAASGEA